MLFLSVIIVFFIGCCGSKEERFLSLVGGCGFGKFVGELSVLVRRIVSLSLEVGIYGRFWRKIKICWVFRILDFCFYKGIFLKILGMGNFWNTRGIN